MDLNKYLDTDDESMHCVDEFHRVHKDNHITEMYEAILTLVPEGKDEKVLDVGCAGGYYSTRLKDKGKIVTGVSINQKDIDHLKTLGVNGIVSDMHELQVPSESINGIFCSHTLEHSPAPHPALTEFYRVLTKGGWLLIVMPEGAGRVISGWRRSIDFGHHYFFPTAEVLMDMLYKVGFDFNVTFQRLPTYDRDASVSALYLNHIWLARK
jgi:ubiquinone/menaquinone biosynthesis C-methylase UbiE